MPAITELGGESFHIVVNHDEQYSIWAAEVAGRVDRRGQDGKQGRVPRLHQGSLD